MNILVINCGSSSIKADVIDVDTRKTIITLYAEKLQEAPIIQLNDNELSYKGDLLFQAILDFCLQTIKTALEDKTIIGIGHRIVHGGNNYSQPVLINDKVEQTIQDLAMLAPLHNPSNLLGIKAAKAVFNDVPNIAVFDTAFHTTLPNRAAHYAIDKNIAQKYAIKRYGFHGTSHKYVSEKASIFLQQDIKNLKIISCHLGNGASVCAVEYGRSVETSMGFTPLEGLVMGTRSGDIDAGILTFLEKKENLTAAQLEDFLNTKSGLAGLSGVGNDMREIFKNAENSNEDARLAIQVFTHRLTKYIGAYAAVMNGFDVLIFTGGIGENSADIRNRVCQNMDFLGIKIDDAKNTTAKLFLEQDIVNISDEISRVKTLVIETNEQLAIALETQKIIEEKHEVNSIPQIPIAISARHVHLTKETTDILFGKDYALNIYKPLSQPGQFASKEMVTLVGPKNKIEHVRILGPFRTKDQVEISKTDEFLLGIDAPIRQSGFLDGTPGLTLVGPKGSVTIKEGVIIALRHIHMHTSDAESFGVKDQDIVSVEIDNGERPITFKNVVVRVSDKFHLEMHIDTDEGNAAEITTGEIGTLIKTQATATLKTKNI